MHSDQPLATLAAGRVAFNLSAIMRRAHHEGRFARQMCRTAAEGHASLSRWLKRAWLDAKREARDLLQAEERAVYARQVMAVANANSATLAARYGNSPDMIRSAIASEGMCDRMDFAAVARLETALSSLGA